jgi:formate dehydrogenase assembly factor FdhD
VAKKFRMTLVGLAHRENFNVYTGHHRLRDTKGTMLK